MAENIIIDGVDVSGCEHYDEVCLGNHHYKWCKDNENCYYKQLKRKEQECQELKKELILKEVANIELSDEVKKYSKAIDEIEEIADNNYEIAEMEQIFLIIGGLDV